MFVLDLNTFFFINVSRIYNEASCSAGAQRVTVNATVPEFEEKWETQGFPLTMPPCTGYSVK